jgi:RNA polymerase sigma factor (sigma-70 family)
VNRPFREVLAVVKRPEDLMRAYRRELRRQRLRARLFAAMNGACTLAMAGTALFGVDDTKGRLVVLGAAAVFGAWTAYDLRWNLPRIGRALAEDPVEANEDRRRLWAALEQLSLEHRTVIALFAVEGLGHKEIAAVLGVPEGTVWSRLHLARKRLAVLLA